MRSIQKYFFLVCILFFSASTMAQDFNLPKVEQYLHLDFEEATRVFENEVAEFPFSALSLLRRARFKQLYGMDMAAREDIERANKLNPYAADLFGFNGPSGQFKVLFNEFTPPTYTLGMPFRMAAYYQLLDQPYLGPYLSVAELDFLEHAIYEIESNNYSVALGQLNELLNAYPNSVIGMDLKGLVLTELGDYGKADDVFSKTVSIEPKYPLVWYNYGILKLKQQQPEQAQQYFDRTIKLQPNLTKAYVERASLFEKQGELQKALADYTAVIEQRQNVAPEIYLNRALIRKQLGDLNGAIQDLGAVIEYYPNDEILYKIRGNLKFLTGAPKLALQDFSKAVQINRNFAEGFYNRGLVNLTLNEYNAGCYDLRQSAALGYDKAIEKQAYFCTR